MMAYALGSLAASLLATSTLAMCSLAHQGDALQLAAPEDRQSLLQVSLHTATRGLAASRHHKGSGGGSSPNATSSPSPSSCVSLTNQGSFFTSNVLVGTPGQSFDLVVDTGSSNLIVPSCACVGCNAHDSCFRKAETSSFSEVEDETGGSGLWVLSYGSGDILAKRVTDVVHVGSVEATMQDDMYLMMHTELDFRSSFEGILPLGLPEPGEPHFLDRAGVDRFSVCFNDNTRPGALLFEPPFAPTMLPQIGQVHWGLGLAGISAGEADAPALACGPSTPMAPGQQTACAAIPDSGTTLNMGPVEHINTMYASLCERWPRCASRAQAPTENARSRAFQTLLYECHDWLPEAQGGINEVPSLFFRLTGRDNASEVVELRPWSWIGEFLVHEVDIVTKELFGHLNVSVPVFGDSLRRVCTAQFGAIDYATPLQGPVWILGAPLFYEYHVVFGRQNPSSGSIGFHRAPCDSCGGGASLVSAEAARAGRSRGPRQKLGRARVRRFDTSQPL